MNRVGSFVLLFLWLVAMGANQQAYGQSTTNKTLTEYLRALSDKYSINLSFSSSLTDKIHLRPSLPIATNDPVKVLTELLKNSGMTFKRIGVTYIIIKEPWKAPVVIPIQKSVPAKRKASPVDTVVVKREPHRIIALADSSVPMLVFPSAQVVLPRLAPIFPAAQESVKSSHWLAIKTNLLYGAYALTPNIGIEIGLNRRTTLHVAGSYNWFNLNGKSNDNKKLAHWIVQPEFRYFLCERFNGSFFGVHTLYSQYNIGGHEMPMMLGKGSADFRHQGWAMGAGVSYGYQLILGKRWNMEFSAGFGYINLRYNKYDCSKCGSKISEENKNYFGPTQAAISLIYIIKSSK